MQKAADRSPLAPPAAARSVRAARSFTLLEVIVALAIAMTFLGALFSGFIQVLRATNRFKARQEALRNGRAAIATIADELKAIGQSGAQLLLVGLNATAPFGDGIDNDGDGVIDEEILNGLDDDGDYVPARDDNHAQIGTGPAAMFERFTFTNQGAFGSLYPGSPADLGDFRVDEDVRFGRDSIVFRIIPASPTPGFVSRTITYTLADFEGRPNTLVREAITERAGLPSLVATAPIAFDVLGLDFLYWDPNGDPNPGSARGDRPYWVETWRSFDAPNFDPPRLPLPAAIFALVTVYADRRPIEIYDPGEPIDVLRVPIVVNLEEIIGDSFYPRPIL
jgi:type II secretory pathway pseudopilin PulG